MTRRRACPRPSSSPPIASTKPRATASPSPTPVPFGAVAEALERLEDPLALPAGMPGPGSTTRRSTRPATAPASTRTGWPAGDRRAARWRRGWRRPARAAPASASTTRQRLGDVERRAGARGRRRPASAPRHDLLEADRRAITSCSAPVCSRLMSSRLPTRSLSRSVSSSIVSRNSRGRSARPVDVALQQARDRRLDRRQRRAQVVATPREQGGPQLVGLGQRLGRGRLGLQPAPLERDGDLGGERRRAPRRSSASRSAPATPAARRRRSSGSASVDRRSRRAVVARPPASSDHAAVGFGAQRPRPRRARTAAARLADELAAADRSCREQRAAERGQGLGLGRGRAVPRPCAAPPTVDQRS